MIPSHSNSYNLIESKSNAKTVLSLLLSQSILLSLSFSRLLNGFSSQFHQQRNGANQNHMSLRKECTCDTVLTVLSPLNLKVPPLKVLVKLLLHGKYFYWIQNSAGLLFPQFMLLVRQMAGPTLSPCSGYCEYPFVTWNSVFFWYFVFSELGSTPSFSSVQRMTLLLMSLSALLKSPSEPTISEQVGMVSDLRLRCSGRALFWTQGVPYSWLVVLQRLLFAVRVKVFSPVLFIFVFLQLKQQLQGSSLMLGQQNQYKQPLLLLKKYHQYLQNKPQEFTEILVHERLVYLIASALQNKEPLPQGLTLLQELTTFINKVNIKVMAGNTLDFNEKLNLASKCIDMLFYKAVRNNLRPQEKLLQLRALCFNNLSCIYKENRQHQDALKALQVALQIQQGLLDKNFEDTYKSIASTYINKCVILSHLSLHEQAIETIKTSLDNLQKYQNRFGSAISEKEQGEIKHMTLLAYYNIAVQHEHLGHSDLSVKFYEMAFKEAKELGNWTIKNQIISALKKLKRG